MCREEVTLGFVMRCYVDTILGMSGQKALWCVARASMVRNCFPQFLHVWATLRDDLRSVYAILILIIAIRCEKEYFFFYF